MLALQQLSPLAVDYVIYLIQLQALLQLAC
jgi:hypothetical protein